MGEVDYNGNTGVLLGNAAQVEWDRMHEAEAKQGSTDEKYTTHAHARTRTGQDAEPAGTGG